MYARSEVKDDTFFSFPSWSVLPNFRADRSRLAHQVDAVSVAAVSYLLSFSLGCHDVEGVVGWLVNARGMFFAVTFALVQPRPSLGRVLGSW